MRALVAFGAIPRAYSSSVRWLGQYGYTVLGFRPFHTTTLLPSHASFYHQGYDQVS